MMINCIHESLIKIYFIIWAMHNPFIEHDYNLEKSQLVGESER